MIELATKSKPLEETLPYFSIEDDLVVLQDGRVALGYEVQPVEMERWQQGDYQHFNQKFISANSALSIGTLIQKFDIFFHQPFKGKPAEDTYFRSRFNSHFQDRLVLFHRSYLFLSFPLSTRYKPNPVNSFFSLGRSVLKNPLNKIEERKRTSVQTSDEFISAIGWSGDIRLNRLSNEALKQLYYQYFNLEFSRDQKGFSRTLLNQNDHLSVGEKKVNAISLIGQGSEVFDCVKNHYNVTAPFTYPLTHYLNFPHLIITSIMVEDTARELKALDLEKKLNSSLDFLTGQDHQIKAMEIDEFTAQVRKHNQPLVSLNLNCLLWDIDDQNRKKNIDKVVSAFQQLQGAQCLVESFDTSNIYYANAPGNGAQNYRWLLMTAANAACYNNYTTTYRSDNSGEYLCDRFRNPILVNFFNTNLNNQNSIVVGPSGSGKSYTVGSLIAQRFEKGHRQIIIDKGGTYKNVITALSGKYFEYDQDSELQFNPFLLEKDARGACQLTNEKINFLTSLLAVIWKGSSRGAELSPAERSVFVELLPMYYQSLKSTDQPSLVRFYHWLSSYHSDKDKFTDLKLATRSFDFEEFLQVLRPYALGEYQFLLNADSETDISDYPLVCFDMERIKNNQMLYPILTLLIVELTLDQIRRYPDDIKYLYMDEAWAMLSDSMGTFVENMYRTVRKNNGSICIITQGVNEIISSKVGRAIIDNADTRIILNHTDKEAVMTLGKIFGFTPHEIDKISSIGVGDTYRELFIKQGEYGKVHCLEVSPYEHAVLSSKPAERNYLKTLIDHYQGNIGYAVNHFVEEGAAHA